MKLLVGMFVILSSLPLALSYVFNLEGGVLVSKKGILQVMKSEKFSEVEGMGPISLSLLSGSPSASTAAPSISSHSSEEGLDWNHERAKVLSKMAALASGNDYFWADELAGEFFFNPRSGKLEESHVMTKGHLPFLSLRSKGDSSTVSPSLGTEFLSDGHDCQEEELAEKSKHVEYESLGKLSEPPSPFSESFLSEKAGGSAEKVKKEMVDEEPSVSGEPTEQSQDEEERCPGKDLSLGGSDAGVSSVGSSLFYSAVGDSPRDQLEPEKTEFPPLPRAEGPSKELEGCSEDFSLKEIEEEPGQEMDGDQLEVGEMEAVEEKRKKKKKKNKKKASSSAADGLLSPVSAVELELSTSFSTLELIGRSENIELMDLRLNRLGQSVPGTLFTGSVHIPPLHLLRAAEKVSFKKANSIPLLVTEHLSGSKKDSTSMRVVDPFAAMHVLVEGGAPTFCAALEELQEKPSILIPFSFTGGDVEKARGTYASGYLMKGTFLYTRWDHRLTQFYLKNQIFSPLLTTIGFLLTSGLSRDSLGSLLSHLHDPMVVIAGELGSAKEEEGLEEVGPVAERLLWRYNPASSSQEESRKKGAEAKIAVLSRREGFGNFQPLFGLAEPFKNVDSYLPFFMNLLKRFPAKRFWLLVGVQRGEKLHAVTTSTNVVRISDGKPNSNRFFSTWN